MYQREQVIIPTLEELRLPKIPDYFPLQYLGTISQFLDSFILSAFQEAIKDKNQMKWARFCKTSAQLWQNIINNHVHDGFLLPEEIDPGGVRENCFAISDSQIIGPAHVGQCFGGLMINEATRMGVAFHIWPLSRWEDDEEAFIFAVNYWKTLKELAPIEPTRFDFAASSGGWKWSLQEDNHRVKRDTRSHSIMTAAFQHVFGQSVPFSRWSTAQIQYDPRRNEVTDPKRKVVLPKGGSIDYWHDLLFEDYVNGNPEVTYTHD